MKKITAYVWAFIVLLVGFVTAGLFTIGACASTGDALTMSGDATVYYGITLDEGETLDAVFVNVGTVYAPMGEDATVTIKTSTATNPSKTSGWTQFGSVVTVANVYGEDGLEGNNYNWIKVGSGLAKSSVKRISVSVSETMKINEIVCLNTKGEVIALNTASGLANSGYALADLEKVFDAPTSLNVMIDEETGAYSISNDAYYNLAQEEGYYMSAVQNLLDGDTLLNNATYTLDGNYNYLATILMAPSVAVFGTSPFAIRFPAFMATCFMLIFAFALVKNTTKSPKLGFFFSVIFAIGGLATSLGRFGAPYALIASALVASLYFMHRFYAKGISSRAIIKGGTNVLLSGICAAFAMAMDITAVIPVVGVLVLFGFGLRRQKLAYKVALAKTEGKEKKAVTDDGEIITVNAQADKVTAEFSQKNRVCYGFAVLSFIMCTAVLLLLAAVIGYSSFVKVHGDAGFMTMVWQGIKASARANPVTNYDATNAANVLAWFIPFRPATVYTGVTAAGAGEYLTWTIAPNAAVTCGCLLAFVASTVKVILDFVKKNNGKNALRMRRTYFILLGGMVAAMAAATWRGNVSAMSGLLFQVFYIGFLPLAAMLLPKGETTGEKALINLTMWAVVGIFAAVFVVSIPALYGMTISESYAKLFVWMSIRSNRYFKVL